MCCEEPATRLSGTVVYAGLPSMQSRSAELLERAAQFFIEEHSKLQLVRIKLQAYSSLTELIPLLVLLE